MRIFLKAPTLAWLLSQDAAPTVLPDFSSLEESQVIVVAHLLGGQVVAEALQSPADVDAALAPGLPLGRLYFRVSKDKLISACPALGD